MIRIVVPICGGGRFVKECLDSVRSCTNWPPYELCLVDNGSEPETADIIDEAKADMVIRFKTNRGFAQACNAGMKTSPFDVVLLNSDTIVTTDWLKRLDDTKADIVGPITNHAHSPQHADAVREAPKWDRQEPNTYAAMLAEKSLSPVRLTDNVLSFFCVLIRSSAMDAIGYLDEGFEQAYGEDNDYCIRARKAGLSVAIAADAFVYHRGAATTNRVCGDVEAKRLRQAGCNRLMAKHGVLV